MKDEYIKLRDLPKYEDCKACKAYNRYLNDHGFEIVDTSHPMWYDSRKTRPEFELRRIETGERMASLIDGMYSCAQLHFVEWVLKNGHASLDEEIRSEWKDAICLESIRNRINKELTAPR